MDTYVTRTNSTLALAIESDVGAYLKLWITPRIIPASKVTTPPYSEYNPLKFGSASTISIEVKPEGSSAYFIDLLDSEGQKAVVYPRLGNNELIISYKAKQGIYLIFENGPLATPFIRRLATDNIVPITNNTKE